MDVWIIDDDPGNVAVAAATAAHLGLDGFRGFLSGQAALAALHSGEPRPQVLLMDFFIAGERGDAVTRQWRAAECGAVRRTLIVGYSSVRWGSEAIVAAGGDTIVRKRRSLDGLNHDLLAFLRQELPRITPCRA